MLLVITDDQGWGDLYSHGNDKLDTPTLDRLATEGARFDRFFVNPVCAPTRAALLTGRYALRSGTADVTRGFEAMRPEEVTLAEVFSGAGYRTALFGKWHNGQHYPHTPNAQGFDEFLGFLGGITLNYFDTRLNHNGTLGPTEGYIADVLTDAAMAFLEAQATEPFFAMVAYNTPHTPYQVPQTYFERYRDRGFDDATAAIYGMVENLDDNIGRLLGRLDDLELSENTIVIFLTDNGPNGRRYNGGMRGIKGSVHEGGVRVPFFIRWPGHIPAGCLVRQIAADIDVLPSLVELASIRPPDMPDRDGISFGPLLQGKPASWPDRLLFTHRSLARRGSIPMFPGAVRSERHRLVREDDSGWQLYDMLVDPGETNDISAAHPDLVARLGSAYESWFRRLGTESIRQPPIPVGYAEAPVVTLPAPEATLHGKLAYKAERGYEGDWIVGWANAEDNATWDIQVARPGRYEVGALYTVPAAGVGARLVASLDGQTLKGTIQRAFDPKPIPSPDRVPRSQVYEKDWAEISLGNVSLNRGPATVSLHAIAASEGAPLDIGGVRIQRLD